MSDNTPTLDPKPMTPEERERRYEELSRMSELSAIWVRPRNPEIAVRWVRNESRDIALHKTQGFRIVAEDPKLPESKRRFETMIPPNEDGNYVYGDVILMEAARMDYEFFIEQGLKRSRLQMDQGKQSFIEESRKRGVPTFERDKMGNRKEHPSD